MFVVTLNRKNLKTLGLGAMCCALVVCSALLGRYISGRTVTAGASVSGKVENAQDIQTWFTGYGLEVDGASITADKVKIPRKWDDSFVYSISPDKDFLQLLIRLAKGLTLTVLTNAFQGGT